MEIKYPPFEFWQLFKKTNGALSAAEAIAIYNISLLAPEGKNKYIELGTHLGKSAISAALGLKGGRFDLVDPIFDKEDKLKTISETIKELSNNFDIKCEMWLVPGYSTDVINRKFDYSYVFVDSGSHGDGLPMKEAKMIEDRVISGGIVGFHDYQNQFVEVAAAYNYLVSTGKYEPINIDWPAILEYVSDNNLDHKNLSWHLYPELPHSPNFVGALRKL